MRRLALFGLLVATPALACAPVPPSGASVRIEREEAIIIWDAATKTQHFIRRAAFDTTAKDFGFLVPTPTQPRLEEADDAAFDALAKLTAPELMRKVAAIKSVEERAPARASVVVLEQKKVAGLDAAVLEATNADALGAWLKQNGYASSAELLEWTRPYIEAKWKITAFKIDAGGAPRAQPGAVRMSFSTDAPFFPYREPASASEKGSRKDGRLLRLYVLSGERVAGVIGKGSPWPGEAVWSDRIAEQDLKGILKLVKLPETSAPQALWLTEFEDRASPRPGTADLLFTPAANQAILKRAQIEGPRPLGAWILLVYGGVLVLLLWAGYKGLRWLFTRGSR